LTLAQLDTFDLARIAARAAADKKAERPVILDVAAQFGIVGAFVICSASNDRLIRTIADEVELRIKEAGGGGPTRVEGLSAAAWVLMDYGDLVVHIFAEEWRSFYDLERLWKDAARVDWDAADVAVTG
jgi:ribosome-associated protein